LRKGAVPPVPFLFLFSLPFRCFSPFLPLRSRALKPGRWSGERCKLPQLGPGPITNLVNSKAVKIPLVAIVLNILSTIILSKTLQNDLYCVEWGVKLYSLTHPIENLALANMTVSDGVESVAQWWGGADPARPPLNPPLPVTF